jgi:DNA-damage-inducible protein J
MTSTAFVRARIDEKLKDEASEVLGELGLTVSDIVRMTLTRIAEDHAVPMELKVPNTATRAAMQESRALMKKHNTRLANAKDLFQTLEKNARRH